MNEFSIENASWRDFNAVRKIEQVCFPVDAWPMLDIVAVLTFPDTVRLKAVASGEMVGFIAGDLQRAENIGWITTLAVLPAYRRLGIGSALLQACEERIYLPKIRLCVRRNNAEALTLYEKRGYFHVGVWKAYYHDGEDALVLEKIRSSQPM